MYGSYTQLLYGKYMLFYESPNANRVYQASPRGGGGGGGGGIGMRTRLTYIYSLYNQLSHGSAAMDTLPQCTGVKVPIPLS